MENPANEVEGVVRALVDKPTLIRQEKALRKYCASDVKIYHPYFNCHRGLEVLIVIYQFAEIMLYYSGVDFHTIVYDEAANCVAIRMTLYIRPWLMFFRTIPLKYLILLELTDVVEDGKTLKKIKVQRDYTIRSPLVQSIPLIGKIYDSDTLRFWAGDISGFIFLLLKSIVIWILRHLPEKVAHGWLGHSARDIAIEM